MKSLIHVTNVLNVYTQLSVYNINVIFPYVMSSFETVFNPPAFAKVLALKQGTSGPTVAEPSRTKTSGRPREMDELDTWSCCTLFYIMFIHFRFCFLKCFSLQRFSVYSCKYRLQYFMLKYVCISLKRTPRHPCQAAVSGSA